MSTFSTAKQAILVALNADKNLPTFYARPPHPETVVEFPIGFLVSEEERAQDDSPRKIVPKNVYGTLTATVYMEFAPDANPDNTLNSYAQYVRDALKTLSTTAPGYTVRVADVQYGYFIEHQWAGVQCTIEVGAYDWFSS